MFKSQDRSDATGGLLSSNTANGSKGRTPSNWLPLALACATVVVLAGLVVLAGGRSTAKPDIAAPGLTAPDPYASQLEISDLKMSEASNFAGSKVTYLEGHIANEGERTLNGVTVQVAFRNALGEIAQKETLPLMLIRTREPYVDTEPVSASPLKPGKAADFRLVFDQVAEDWNQQYPEVRITSVEAR